MSAVLQRIAALANGLTKAELHVLIELVARAQTPSAVETTASSRELAQKTGLARASVQTAIGLLNKKQLIRSSSGNATQPAVHTLLCLEPVENPADNVTAVPEVAQVLSHGGPTARPVPAQILSQGGPKNEPPEAQNLGQGGLKIRPGVAQELGRVAQF
jgi:DNA-binding transcriptional MocR family regulator